MKGYEGGSHRVVIHPYEYDGALQGVMPMSPLSRLAKALASAAWVAQPDAAVTARVVALVRSVVRLA